MSEEAKPISGRAKVLLQLCQQGKGEIYGEQLAQVTIFDNSFYFDVQGAFELHGEIEAYFDVARQHKVRSALERWRHRGDEGDAEIVYDNYKLLDPPISIVELLAAWYDSSPKKLRAMLEKLEGILDIDDRMQLVSDIRFLTSAIPLETSRDFPYERLYFGLILRPTKECGESRVRAIVLDQIDRLVQSYRDGTHSDIRMEVEAEFIYDQMCRRLSFILEEWELTYDDIRTSREELQEIAAKYGKAA